MSGIKVEELLKATNWYIQVKLITEFGELIYKGNAKGVLEYVRNSKELRDKNFDFISVEDEWLLIGIGK